MAKHNKKMLKILNEIYNSLHLFAGYDGSLLVSNLKERLKLAKELIDWIYKQVKDKL